MKLLISAVFLSQLASSAMAGSLLLQSTTSTKNSGLYSHLLPEFEAATGIRVNVVAVGTGQAIKNAANCDGDVLIVHAKSAEENFVAMGGGLERHDLMFNDFVIVGPENDPAGINGMADVSAALQAIEAAALFASRGDDSGTHKKEMTLWSAAGIDPTGASGTWYRETGAGMGATLNTSVGMEAYVLTDRATWITFGNKLDFVIHVEGNEALFNQYGVIQVNPERCPQVNAEDARTFVNWLLSEDGQSKISAYKVEDQQLFFPNAAQGE